MLRVDHRFTEMSLPQYRALRCAACFGCCITCIGAGTSGRVEYASLANYDTVRVWMMWNILICTFYATTEYNNASVTRPMNIILYFFDHIIALWGHAVVWSRLHRYVTSTNTRIFVLHASYVTIWPNSVPRLPQWKNSVATIILVDNISLIGKGRMISVLEKLSFTIRPELLQVNIRFEYSNYFARHYT